MPAATVEFDGGVTLLLSLLACGLAAILCWAIAWNLAISSGEEITRSVPRREAIVRMALHRSRSPNTENRLSKKNIMPSWHKQKKDFKKKKANELGVCSLQ